MATTYYQAAKSGFPLKNAGGTVLNGGNATTTGRTPPVTNVLSLQNNAIQAGNIGSRVFLAVSPADSGNIGTIKPLTGAFARMEKGQYVGMIIGSRIAQVNNTILQSTGGSFARKNGFTLTPLYKYQVLNILSWNAVTGVATKGGNTGSGITFASDKAATPTDAIPGRLVYLVGSTVPTQDSYKARTGT